jgi:DNA-binding MarR family transcriptional regulator
VPDELQNQFCQLGSMERTLIVRFATAIHVLLELYHRLTIAQATTFLAVWAEEGLTVSTLALRCGVEPQTVSRHLRILTSRNIRGVDGLGLLVVKDRRPQGDLRHRYVFLTERGSALAARMLEVMEVGRLRRIAPMGILDRPD